MRGTGSSSFCERGQYLTVSIDRRFTFKYGSLKIRCKETGECQHIFIRSQDEIVLGFLSQVGFAFPTQGYIISGFIEHTLQHGTLGILTDNGCRMFIVRIPIAGIISMCTRGIRKAQIDTGMCTAGDTGGNHILIGMADCLYIESVTIQCEVAGDFTFPHIQCLADIGDIRCFHSVTQFQANDPQVQAVRIDAEPVGSFFLPSFFLELAGVEFFVSTTEVKGFQDFFRLVSLRIGK